MKTCMSEQKISTQNLDSLGIVASLCGELGIADKINKKLYNNDKRRIVTPGKAVEAMILNGLGLSNRVLYLTSRFFKEKPISILLNEDIQSTDLTAYTLGHTLDAIYNYGCERLFSELAFEMALEKALLGELNNVDTTTFSLQGDYDKKSSKNPEDPEGPTPIQITYGYSKDKRPDLKQFTLSLVMNSKAELPIYSQSLDGNSSDKKTLQKTIESVIKFQENIDYKKPLRWIADSALYSKTQLLKENKFNWITRIPHSIKESKILLSKKAQNIKWKKSEKGYKYSVHDSNYGNIPQKWLLIYSNSKYKKERVQLLKSYKSEKEAILKRVQVISRKLYKSEKILKETVKEASKKLKYFKLVTTIKKEERIKKGLKEDIYKLDWELKSNINTIRQKIQTLGRFILGTNDIEEKYQSMDEILELYKSQQNVERGFRFLKDPWFMVDDFYLKKPERIEAWMGVMTLTLFVYNYGQYKLRKALKDEKETLPNQKGKKVTKPTLKWVFQLMQGISVVLINDGNNELQKVVTNIDCVRKKIIFLMNNRTPEIYKLAKFEFT